MTWAEIEQLTDQVQQLPPGRQRTSQQLSQVMVSAHSTMIEGSRVTVLEAFDFLLGATPTLGPGKPLAGYDMLGDHARALDLALQRADARQLPDPTLLRELAAAVMQSTGRLTNTALGTVDPSKGDLRRGSVFIVGASSFPNAQKVPAMVATLTDDLRARMPVATTLREQLELAFEAHQRLVSIHPFNDGNGRTSRLLMNYVQRYYRQPLTIVFREDRQAYFSALEQSRVAEDLTVFLDFMRGQHAKSLTYQLTAVTPPEGYSL
ncbi:filamentation induced by cAMP protein Fic [Hymenobacter roseosalivarius DSM 11622]|uniref:Filamentation induced by cAMP protein Fic n=1 Tax=Hymenobacter roseosalivarius DSM 11622 TaxID=645990 RepID=A0A1W1W5E8_9BACT|nr:Fic family protein [Hymenobacter roseosalivarius]SMC00690.1 filamentation induced by cAMP protein Fic [Hymenobacter roseosalivarius DSM 11622]